MKITGATKILKGLFFDFFNKFKENAESLQYEVIVGSCDFHLNR